MKSIDHDDNYVPAGVHLIYNYSTGYYKEVVGDKEILCLTGMRKHIELPNPAPWKMVIQFTTRPRVDSFKILGTHSNAIRVKGVPEILTLAMDAELALQRVNGRKYFHFEYEEEM